MLGCQDMGFVMHALLQTLKTFHALEHHFAIPSHCGLAMLAPFGFLLLAIHRVLLARIVDRF